jgi:hypothetical protein
MKRVAFGVLLTAIIIASPRAETDTLIAAVGFALTGSDNAKVQVINRTQCVFGIENEVFHLNNLHVERISIQGLVQKSISGEIRTVTVDLHGEGVVHEVTMRRGITSSEKSLILNTSETERVIRAWQYIYANGCVGKKSPF